MEKKEQEYWKGEKDLTRDTEVGHKRIGRPVYAGDLFEWAYRRLDTQPALLTVCKAVEFVWIQDSMVEACPWCGGTKLLGHNDNCQRQSAIAAAEGEVKT